MLPRQFWFLARTRQSLSLVLLSYSSSPPCFGHIPPPSSRGLPPFSCEAPAQGREGEVRIAAQRGIPSERTIINRRLVYVAPRGSSGRPVYVYLQRRDSQPLLSCVFNTCNKFYVFVIVCKNVRTIRILSFCYQIYNFCKEKYILNVESFYKKYSALRNRVIYIYVL